MDEYVKNIIHDNPYFGAGFGLVGLGAALTGARKALNVGLILFRRHYVMTNEITIRDPSYPWVLNWFNQQKDALQVNTIVQLHQRASGKFEAKLNYAPSVGVHYIKFDNRWMKVERERQQTVDLTMGGPFETIRFTCLGTNKKIFTKMINHAMELELSKHEGKMVTYTARTSSWEPKGEPRRAREFDSVILDEGLAERILHNIKKFLNSREKYQRRGIPYKLNYLLYGPPGCGKTSYVKALAGAIGYDLCILNLSNFGLDDERLEYLMDVLPPSSILLLEDIDAALPKRDKLGQINPAHQGLGRLTLAGALNAFDGAASGEDRIVFMTTNFRDQLDAAVLRKGRIDHEAYIGYASDLQLARAFERFYSESIGESFVKEINAARSRARASKKRTELSMAEVQAHFLEFEESSHDALSHVDELFRQKRDEA